MNFLTRNKLLISYLKLKLIFICMFIFLLSNVNYRLNKHFVDFAVAFFLSFYFND
jgi:hypothetical protein